MLRYISVEEFAYAVPYAGVAQSVEQLIRNQQVAGSSPASSSKKENTLAGVFFFAFTGGVWIRPTED